MKVDHFFSLDELSAIEWLHCVMHSAPLQDRISFYWQPLWHAIHTDKVISESGIEYAGHRLSLVNSVADDDFIDPKSDSIIDLSDYFAEIILARRTALLLTQKFKHTPNMFIRHSVPWLVLTECLDDQVLLSSISNSSWLSAKQQMWQPGNLMSREEHQWYEMLVRISISEEVAFAFDSIHTLKSKLFKEISQNLALLEDSVE